MTVRFISEDAEFVNLLHKIDAVCTDEPSMTVFAVGAYLAESSIVCIKEQGGEVNSLTDLLVVLAAKYIENKKGEE